MKRLTYLLKAIAISSALFALWLFKESVFGALQTFASVMIFFRPRDGEWMAKEMLADQKKESDRHYSKLISAIRESLR